MAQGVLDRLTFQSGDEVFKEGEPGNQAYVIQDGMVDIIRTDPEGNEIVLGSVEKGGIFGEMALIDDQPRMASARAATGTTLIIINRDMFHAKLAKCDPFIRGLLGIFVKNIRSMVDSQLSD
ncbi:MAG: cyclic nucleotide-binding domain-containing protein [Rhodospirillales bacterium]|jgi:CRP-like cAMP-binding protein|nr:cAMP-binding protein [Rhodospirillaceae bacterium]MDP6427542.1 cyclic nucleotide-binding domain-containing protein [Rhodospirillales bacterium]MDP6643187.1 cyclic nucleotide-binding domain-containing protein [Rhodospirillales bacterium]MDP6843808.1 cyclic nucleotide-binding domain-containing protein [Rhodospirillales bacterium]|tara:strand:+ start:941 stop:1306 length:366 start_codon:yes stop_codon:yes gene_type:complete